MRDDQETPSPRVLEQRVRNRIMEYLDLMSSYAEQTRYDRAAPSFVNVPYELIHQWQDWLPLGMETGLDHMVFTTDEVDALREYHQVWDAAADAVPDDYPPLSEVQRLPEWAVLTRTAQRALHVFDRRGRLSEDSEEPS